MAISEAVIHHISSSGDGRAELSLGEPGLAEGTLRDELHATLKASFLSRISREHGSFRSEGEAALLAHELDALLAESTTLAEAGRSFAEAFKTAIAEKKIELDRHLIFVREKSLDHHTFYLFAAQRKEVLMIADDLTPRHSATLDSGPSLFGIKVDLNQWRAKENYAYLSLLPPRGNSVLAEVFTELSGFSNGINKEEATLAFLEGVEVFTKTVPEERQKELRDQVVDYCMAQDERDAPVTLKELAQEIDGINPDEFVKIVARHTPDNEEEVMMDRRSLRRYVKFAGREKDLAISFSSFQLNHRVLYDEERDTLTITEIPKALRKQLLAHLHHD